jgi:hypothetical protein
MDWDSGQSQPVSASWGSGGFYGTAHLSSGGNSETAQMGWNVQSTSGDPVDQAMLSLEAKMGGWQISAAALDQQVTALKQNPIAAPTLTDPTPPPAAAQGTDLSASYAKAFGKGEDPQSKFLQGLPQSLPKNALGEPYDPGTPMLDANKEAILQQLVHAGALKLGLTPPELAAQQTSAQNQAAFDRYRDSLGSSPQTALQHVGTLADMANAVTAAQDTVDSIGDLGTDLQMRLQLAQDRYSKIMEALSNIMKKMADTGQTLVENLK